MKKIYLIAAIVAILAGFATYFFATQVKENSTLSNENTSNVVVAIKDIDADTVVTADMFQVLSLPVSTITYGTVVNIDDIVGMMTTSKIMAGEQVLAKKLSVVGTSSDENRLSYQLEPGQYAFSMSLDELNGVSGFLKQGDYINIYEVTSGGTNQILENVEILRLSTYAANKSQESEGIEITSYTEVVLVLTKDQIAALTQAGTLKVALVPYVEGADIVSDLVEDTSEEREVLTNYGMGEITTTAPSTEAAQ